MSKNERFEGKYSVSDGYVGGDRPHYFIIRSDDLPVKATDDELEEFYNSVMMESYEQNISPEPERIESFVQWAKVQIKNRGGE